MVRVILADDHSLMRDILRHYVSLLEGSVEILEAATLQGVLKHSDNGQPPPDLILLDLDMPGMNGLNGIVEVKENFSEAKIIVVSAIEDKETILNALQVGIAGYIPKTTSGQSLVSAIQLVMNGDRYLPATLLSDTAKRDKNERAEVVSPLKSDDKFSKLTARENSVMCLLIQGKTNKEIARVLRLEEVTIKVHLRNIFRKIDASNRTDAVRIALQCDWQPEVATTH